MQEDQMGCKKNNIRAEEEQTTAARTTLHEQEEEDTGIRPAGSEQNRNKERNTAKQTKQASKTSKCRCYRFRTPPNELNENKQNLPLTVGFTT